MKIIYMHHAERDINEIKDEKFRQMDDITQSGIKEADLLAERLNHIKVKAIVTSLYLRCKHTAEILNKYINVPIIEDERFNECGKNEEWKKVLERNMTAIDDIVKKYDNDDTIICVTSGVNISAFICYFYGLKPENSIPYTQAASISPVYFKITK